MRERDKLMSSVEYVASPLRHTGAPSMTFNDAAFGPSTVILMTRAFDAAFEELSAHDIETSEASKKLMALGIMLAVQTGERDYEALKRIAVSAASHELPSQK